MGRVRITNAHDLLRAARGEIAPTLIRYLEADAQTDRGAALLVVPPAVAAALGLGICTTRRVLYDDGREADLPGTTSVVLEMGGRRLLCEALVESGRTAPLVGGAALESLGILPDPVALAIPSLLAPPLGRHAARKRPLRLWGALRARLRGLAPASPRPHWGFLARMPMTGERGPTGQHHGTARRPPGHRDGPTERSRRMNGIDETIERVESLYRSLTGREPPINGGLGIPPEKDPAQHLTEQVERLIGALAPAARPQTPASSPLLSVWESATETRICVEMPGVSREGVRLSVTRNLLALSATADRAEEGFTLRLSERPGEEFCRTIALPPGVSEEDIRAQMRNGVLEIRFARRDTTSAATRPIPIA